MEQMIQSLDLSYIPQILSCFPIDGYQLPQLDADMRRAMIVCEIAAAEERLGGRPLFLENAGSFDGLMQKYIRTTFLLRRIELGLPEDALAETAEMLASGQISACALKKITECEIFSDPGYVFQQAMSCI